MAIGEELVVPSLDDVLGGERGSRRITLDKGALAMGRIVPVDAETGEVITPVRDVELYSPVDGCMTLTLTLLLTEPYQKTET